MITQITIPVSLHEATRIVMALRMLGRYSDRENKQIEKASADRIECALSAAVQANAAEAIEARKDATLAAIATRQAGATTLGSGH